MIIDRSEYVSLKERIRSLESSGLEIIRGKEAEIRRLQGLVIGLERKLLPVRTYDVWCNDQKYQVRAAYHSYEGSLCLPNRLTFYNNDGAEVATFLNPTLWKISGAERS